MGSVELPVSEECLDNVLSGNEVVSTRKKGPSSGAANPYLAIVEGALYREVVYIRVRDCRHLGFLDGRDPPFWMKDENRDICLITEAVDCGTGTALRGQ